MRHMVLCLLLLTSLTACASLHIHPDDSTGVKVIKGLARVPVAILTLGRSEVWHAHTRAMESWVGTYETDLLMAWGPPTAEYSDGSGGKIIVYTENRTYVSPGKAYTTTEGSATGYTFGDTIYAHGSAESTTTYTPPQVYQWQVFRQFHINSSGTVDSYSWRGL